jgi:hypothetical protein
VSNEAIEVFLETHTTFRAIKETSGVASEAIEVCLVAATKPVRSCGPKFNNGFVSQLFPH